MKLTKNFFILILLGLFSFQSYAFEDVEPRVMTTDDAIGWMSFRATKISDGGKWFMYRTSPNDGDSLITIRSVSGNTEYNFPMGQAPARGNNNFALSKDGKWAAFIRYPTMDEAKKLKKKKEKPINSIVLVDLSNGETSDFEKAKNFSFSNENPNWIAIHKTQATKADAKDKKNKWSGSDLLLKNLNDGRLINIGNVSEYAFNHEGSLLGYIVDAEGKVGNGIVAKNLSGNFQYDLDYGDALYKKLSWSEKTNELAALKGVESDEYEKPNYSLLGFKNFRRGNVESYSYDPSGDENFPSGMTISPNRAPFWMANLDQITFGIHENPMKEKEEEEGDDGDVSSLIIWHYKDKRPQSRQWVTENQDKNFNYLSTFNVNSGQFIRLADEEVRNVSVEPGHAYAVGLNPDPYDPLSYFDGRRYNDVYAINMETGERSMMIEKARWTNGPSPDGTEYLYYREGNFQVYDMENGNNYNATQNVPTSFINYEDDHNVIDPPRQQGGFRGGPFGWSSDGKSLVLYDGWDVWKISAHGDKGQNLTKDGKENQIRYGKRFVLDADEKGIDLSEPMYLSRYGEWTKKGGIARVDNARSGAKVLEWGDAHYDNILMAEDSGTLLFRYESQVDVPEYYSADSDLEGDTKITHLGDQAKAYKLSQGRILVDYESDHGAKLQGALYLPADYEPGKKYPTLVYFYEKLSQNLNRFSAPDVRRFNTTRFTSNGYAVFNPDIVYEINDPGMSAVWAVLPGVQAAIETGVVDEDKLGMQGHSWGGYQSSMLVTQTDIFKATITGAPLTNLFSMYGSNYWNSGNPDAGILESSQGRMKSHYLDEKEAYERNSPVYHADKVTQPLMILHNDLDGAVDWNQGIEFWNILNRLGKEVVMLEYKGENHGVRNTNNSRDYAIRMVEYFDHFLKGVEAPDWLNYGVDNLDMKDHMRARSKKNTEGYNNKKKPIS